jgi:hypothetical protein
MTKEVILIHLIEKAGIHVPVSGKKTGSICRQ